MNQKTQTQEGKASNDFSAQYGSVQGIQGCYPEEIDGVICLNVYAQEDADFEKLGIPEEFQGFKVVKKVSSGMRILTPEEIKAQDQKEKILQSFSKKYTISICYFEKIEEEESIVVQLQIYSRCIVPKSYKGIKVVKKNSMVNFMNMYGNLEGINGATITKYNGRYYLNPMISSSFNINQLPKEFEGLGLIIWLTGSFQTH